MTQYVAVTTTNPQGGWRVVTIGEQNESKATVEAQAEQAITHGQPVTDIYAETELRNLAILPRSTVERKPHLRAALIQYIGVDMF